jgi:hypothetical protein
MIQNKPFKLIDVYGIKMSTTEEMAFSKYIASNHIAMSTKTADERLAIVLAWQDIYFKLI